MTIQTTEQTIFFCVTKRFRGKSMLDCQRVFKRKSLFIIAFPLAIIDVQRCIAFLLILILFKQWSNFPWNIHQSINSVARIDVYKIEPEMAYDNFTMKNSSKFFLSSYQLDKIFLIEFPDFYPNLLLLMSKNSKKREFVLLIHLQTQFLLWIHALMWIRTLNHVVL